jgi:hypothetical protein
MPDGSKKGELLVSTASRVGTAVMCGLALGLASGERCGRFDGGANVGAADGKKKGEIVLLGMPVGSGNGLPCV